MPKSPVILLLVYVLIFSCILLSYPLHGSLPSDMDSWYYIASFNYYYQSLVAHFQGVDIGRPLFPAVHPYLNGEPSFGIFLIWLPLKLSMISDIWAYYGLIVIICVVNAFGVYKLAGYYYPTARPISAFLAGMFFSFNNFMIANIDSPNTIFWGIGILSIYYFNLFISEGQGKYIILCTALIIWQMFISVYDFMYTGIFIVSIAFFHMVEIKKAFTASSKLFLSCLTFAGFVLILYIYVLLSSSDKSTSWNYSNSLDKVKFASFALSDFTRVLPGNIYYHQEAGIFWLQYFKCLFLGFMLSLMGLTGLAGMRKKRPEFLLIIFISVIIGIGTYIIIGHRPILMPLGILYEMLHAYSFYRFPFRIFIVINLITSICAVYSIEYLLYRVKYKSVWMGAIALCFLLENVPLSRTYYDSDRYFAEGNRLNKKFSNKQVSTFLFLPSGDFINAQTPLINKTEQIYMFWQSCLKANMVNGYTGFFPKERVEMNTAIQNFKQDKAAFIHYLRKYKIDHIVYYRPAWGLIDCPIDIDSARTIADQQNIDFEVR